MAKSWQIFLTANRSDPRATLLLTIGGDAPNRPIRRIEAQRRKTGRDSYAVRMQAAIEMQAQYNARADKSLGPMFADCTSLGTEGCYMRLVHHAGGMR